MKEVVHIKGFNAGIIGGIDERDVPVDAFAYSENVNPAQIQGKLSGIEDDSEVVSDATYDAAVTAASGGAGGVSVSANYEEGDSVVLLDTGNGAIVEITDIDGDSGGPNVDEIDAAPTVSGTPKAMVSDGSAVHIGMGPSSSAAPQWVGEIDYGQFTSGTPGLAAPTGTQVASGVLKYGNDGGAGPAALSYVSAVDEGTNDVVLEANTNYYWFVALQYDGYQEGPISLSQPSASFAVQATAKASATFTITVNDSDADWNRRISALVIYRGASTDLSGLPSAEPVHVATIDIDSGSWGGVAGAYTYTFVDDNLGGSSYTDRTGIPASQGEMNIYWGLSCASDQYHFIADVVTSFGGVSFNEAKRAIFRSQAFKFDMWDKTEFVLLPTKPNAIAAHSGRVYAFADNRVWVIDAATLDIVSEITGIGCFGPDSIVSTDYGLFFCDKNNIYVTDAEGRITPIGNPVLKNDVDSDAAYLSRSTGTNPVVAYDARYNAYVIAYVNASGTVSYLMYRPQQRQTIDLPQGRWDHVKTAYTALGARIASNLPHPLMVLDGDIVQLFGSTSKRAWTVTLREFETPEFSKYYDADILGDEVTLEYSEDGGAFATASTAAYGTGAYRGEVNSRTGRAWTRVHTHQLRLTGTANQEVDSLAVNRRRMTRA